MAHIINSIYTFIQTKLKCQCCPLCVTSVGVNAISHFEPKNKISLLFKFDQLSLHSEEIAIKTSDQNNDRQQNLIT